MSEIADKLDEARALIEKGWVQDIYEEVLGGVRCFCSLGAIAQTTAEAVYRAWQTEEARALALAISGEKHAGLDIFETITDFNDAPERTQAEVIEAFRKAAALARSEAAAVGGR